MVMLFPVWFSLILGCSGAHYSSLVPEDSGEKDKTVDIIVGKHDAIMKTIVAVAQDKFVLYGGRVAVSADKVRFRGRGRGSMTIGRRGDVEVTIGLDRVSGVDEKGKRIEGYSFQITSEGRGFNPSLNPRYAVDMVREALFQDPFYDLKLAGVRKVKKEKPEGRAEESLVGVGYGSGFVLGRLPLIVTNYHVVEEKKEVDIVFPDMKPIKGRVMKRDKKNDLAIIEFKDERPERVGFRIFPSHKVAAGQQAFVIGYPLGPRLGENPGITNGIVSSTAGIDNDSRHFRISVPTNPGNSGGPLLDSQGRVTGIVSHGLNAIALLASTGGGAVPQGTNFAIKSDILISLYPELASIVDEKETLPLPSEKIFSNYFMAVPQIRVEYGKEQEAKTGNGQ
jgi:S1-C subfamily serine protease